MSRINDTHLFEVQFTSALCETVGTPRALMVKLLIENQEWRQLADLTIDPAGYVDGEKFADDYLVSSVLTKSDHLPIKIDLDAECEALFRKCESVNAVTNARLIGAKHPDWFYTVQSEFRTILGPLSPGRLKRISDSCKFGPGVHVGVNGMGLVPSIKYDSTLSLTHALVPFCRSLMGENWWSYNQQPREVVRGSEFFTVPKKATAKRGCAKEPAINMFGQSGIGQYLQKRLAMFGIDISDQTRNQQLAGRAWTDGLATIDLSNASNLMSRGVVWELATTEWSHLLDLFRSPEMKMPGGDWVELQMHSSMGNGYTFALETAIFAAVVRASVPTDLHDGIAVYGDDIVCPQRYAPVVIERLEYLGFQVNSRKTSLAGSFFESCGQDFFRGVNVRPFYLRRQRDAAEAAPYFLEVANSLRIYANRRGGGEFCDIRWKPLWDRLVKAVPGPWKKTYVPASLGNAGIIVDSGDKRLRRPSSKGRFAQNEGYVARYVVREPVLLDRETHGVLLATLKAGSSAVLSRGKEPRRGFLGRAYLTSGTVLWCPGFAWS